MAEPDKLLRWFGFAHLNPELQEVSRPFHVLATAMCHKLNPSAERTIMLRKLIEAKDNAVRAYLEDKSV